MIKKNELIKKINENGGGEYSLKDELGEGDINYLSNQIDEVDCGFVVSFDEVSDGDSYTMAHYFSNKLQQTIMLSWGVEVNTIGDLIDELYLLEKKAKHIEKNLMVKVKTFYFVDNENQTIRITGFEGTPKQFEKKFWKFNEKFTSQDDPEYSDFYDELSKALKCEAEGITEIFYQNR